MPERQQAQRSTESKSTAQKQATPRIQTPISHPMAIIQRARMNPKSLTPGDVMQLQSTIGNRAVVRLLSEIGLIPSKAKQAPPVQRQELVQRQEIPEEEEPLQGKMAETVQRQEIPEEEEPLQGKLIEPIQRQEPEEDEKLQMKSIVQRQEIPEEEEPLQGKMIGTIQRQEIPEEEEPLQGKFENKPEICPSCFAAPIVQRQEIPEEEEPLQGKFESIQRQEIPEEEEPLQTKKENNTGMPDNLKVGVESLSGIDMSDVRVHYNSSKPAEVGALAYTQGTNIHVAPGQERHLAHEAWHVVQQVQGRVRPTMQLKGVQINDEVGLEKEADLLGEKASNFNEKSNIFVEKKYNNWLKLEERTVQKMRFNEVGDKVNSDANVGTGEIDTSDRGKFERDIQSIDIGTLIKISLNLFEGASSPDEKDALQFVQYEIRRRSEDTKKAFFLSSYKDKEPYVLSIASSQLEYAHNDVDLARKYTDFLVAYRKQSEEVYEIAQQELERANGNIDNAKAKMDLYLWAMKEAKKEADISFEEKKQRAEYTESSELKEAEKLKSLISKSVFKDPNKRKNHPEYIKYQAIVKAVREQKEGKLEEARIEKKKVEEEKKQDKIDLIKFMTEVEVKLPAEMVLRLLSKIESLKIDTDITSFVKTCKILLTERNVPEGKVTEVATFCLKCTDTEAQTFVIKTAIELPDKTEKCIEYLLSFKSVIYPLTTLQKLGLNNGLIYDIRSFFDRLKLDEIEWLFKPEFTQHHSKMLKFLEGNKFTDLKKLVKYSLSFINLDLPFLLDTIGSKLTVKKLRHIIKNMPRGEESKELVNLCTQFYPPEPLTFDLLRVEACLRSGAQVTFEVSQPDIEYKGSLQDPKSRTGFMKCILPGGSVVIHTHWNPSNMKLSSIHTKEGLEKGFEFTELRSFNLTLEAVVSAHNKASSDSLPTKCITDATSRVRTFIRKGELHL